MKQEEYFGTGSIETLSKIISAHKTKNVFLVTGKKSYHLSGAENLLNKFLKDLEVFHFNEFSENPKLEDIENGIEQFKNSGSEIVIAVGGGSVIDIGKLINIFSAQSKDAINYIEGKANILNKGKTLIAVPSTSGAGSESTHFAVVYKDKAKYSVAHDYILPDISIIDPQLTFSLPPEITATSGIDALSQAIESYWCVNSNEESKNLSEEAIKLIFKNLDAAVNNPRIGNRVSMSKAANLAGKAINITKTTAPHAVSYSMTSYFAVPHGQAVSLTLAEFLVYNYEVTNNDLIDKRGVAYVRKSIDELIKFMACKTVYEAKEKITKLIADIGLKTKLSELSINSENDLKLIEENVNLERLQNNPRKISKDGLKIILRNIL